METVEKMGKAGGGQHGPVIPRFTSDATKVTSKGLGLKKAHLNRQNNFTVNASAAGINCSAFKEHYLSLIFIEINSHLNFEITYFYFT